jgi:hypothetical protein
MVGIASVPRDLKVRIEIAATHEARSTQATATSEWGLDAHDMARAKTRLAEICPPELREKLMPLHIYTLAFLKERTRQSTTE